MTPTPELEPCDTPTEPVVPLIGFCDWCGEPVFDEDGYAYFPPAHDPKIACGGCVARRHDLGVGG